MNIQDRIAEAMVTKAWCCNRCGFPAQGYVDVIHREGDSHYLLCDACLTDFGIFMETPPEIPDQDTSSVKLLPTEGEDNGANSSP